MFRWGRWLLFALSLLSGSACTAAATSARVTVSVDSGQAVPIELLVSVYDRFHALKRNQSIPHSQYPSQMIVELPALDQSVRIAVVAAADGGGMLLGGTALDALRERQVTGEITLSAKAVDADGDSVTDAIDDCPLVANPDQADHNGDGVGDACPDDGDGGRAGDLGSDGP